MTQIFVKTQTSERLYKLPEVDDEVLAKLVGKYPLDPAQQDGQTTDQLFLVIAVHAEDARRKSGGIKQQRQPNIGDMAEEIVDKGFRSASKRYHPDRDGGQNHLQQLLGQARDRLQSACKAWTPEPPIGSLIVDSDGLRRVGSTINDDDIPF